MRNLSACKIVLVVVLSLLPETAAANGKRRVPEPAPSPDGKKVIAVDPVEQVQIELPDQSIADFGEGFEERLRTDLFNRNKYVVVDGERARNARSERRGLKTVEPPVPGYYWPDYSYVPAATVRISVEALSFVTGSRGNRMFYGFDERMRTPFNDGRQTYANEFPLRNIAFEPNWFDRTFDAIGTYPFDSRAGLDLGDGFSVNALYAWLSVKYARYRSDLSLRVEVDAPLVDRHEIHQIRVKGQGYFYDIVGAYDGFSVGIGVARRDAMLRATENGLKATLDTIDRALQNLPLTGRVDHVVKKDGRTLFLLGTGANSAIRPGTLYEVLEAPGVFVSVVSAQTECGAIGQAVRGDASVVQAGMTVRQVHELPSASSSFVSVARFAGAMARSSVGSPSVINTEIQLPSQNLPKAEFQQGETPVQSWFEALWKSIVEESFLPYRLWRYAMYDRSYHSAADADMASSSYANNESDHSLSDSDRLANWHEQALNAGWAKQIGLSRVDFRSSDAAAPIVALIDTGMDYNHPILHSSLWLNPTPVADPRGQKDNYGWDFSSGDGRPFDDGYHGTELASVVVAVAPQVKIMPLKVFNPWGVTSSAAIYAAFQYAVDHGAKIILCGWATRQYSKAIEMGVEYARHAGAVVVSAAGDRGDQLQQVAVYPAVLSDRYDNVLAVTGVDLQDRLVTEHGHYANYDPKTVHIAAPGTNVSVARPRSEYGKITTTSVAAAIVAGALARVQNSSLTYQDWINGVISGSDAVSGLRDAVRDGVRLRISK